MEDLTMAVVPLEAMVTLAVISAATVAEEVRLPRIH
jgi:hypothetical protein